MFDSSATVCHLPPSRFSASSFLRKNQFVLRVDLYPKFKSSCIYLGPCKIELAGKLPRTRL